MGQEARGAFGERLWIARRAALTPVALLLLLSLLAFANAFHNGFAFDDESIIVRNNLLQQLDQIPILFITDYWAGSHEDSHGWERNLYRPLVLVTFALNYAVGGLAPLGYHVVNLLLHMGVSLLLYDLARQIGLSIGAALAASALFAVHPLHTEAVAGVVGRTELLLALGVLVAVRWYGKASVPNQPRLRSILVSLGGFAVALLSKEQAVMLPALLILYECSRMRKSGRDRMWLRSIWPQYLGCLLLPGAFLLLRAGVLGTFLPRAHGRIPFLDNPLAHVSWLPRVLTAVKVAGKYLWLFVWPAMLSADYSYDAIPRATSVFEPQVLGALAAWGGLLGLASFSYLRGRRIAFFGVGFTVLSFLPAANLLIPIGTIMGERLFYLPSAGLCLVVGAGLDQIRAWASSPGRLHALKWVGVGTVTALLLLLTARTILRNRDWRDSEALFGSALQVVPRSTKVHFNLGVLYANKGEVQQAMREYEAALRIYPEYPNVSAPFNEAYGISLFKTARYDEAIEALERATALGSPGKKAHFTLGLAYAKKARFDEAEIAFGKALALDVNDPIIYTSLSFVLGEQERYDEALAAADAAIRLNPAFAEAHYFRGHALEVQGHLREALASYQQALHFKPDLSVAIRRLEQLRPRLLGEAGP